MRVTLTTTAWGYVLALPVLALLSAVFGAWHMIDDAIGYRQL